MRQDRSQNSGRHQSHAEMNPHQRREMGRRCGFARQEEEGSEREERGRYGREQDLEEEGREGGFEGKYSRSRDLENEEEEGFCGSKGKAKSPVKGQHH